jgi:hypothetical protein
VKKSCLFIILIIITNCFCSITLKAQVSAGGSAIIIDNSVSTQYLPKIRVAQNGWIFAGFITDNDYRIFRSKDTGRTWTKIIDNSISISDWDLEVTGGTSTDTTVNLWAAFIYESNSLNVYTFNGSTGSSILEMGYIPSSGVTCKNVCIATDYKNPGFVANPYSIAIALSLDGVANDSLLLFISNNAGTTWNHSNVYATIDYLHRVSLAYGYSPINNTGRFFLAGEYNFTKNANDNNQDIFYLWEQEDLSGIVGLGYVDSVDINWASHLSHPEVIVQNSSANENDSLDLSAIILFNTGDGLRGIASMTSIKNTINYQQWFVNNIISVYNNNAAPTTADGVYNDGNNCFIFTAGDTSNNLLNYYTLNIDSIGHGQDTSGYTPYETIYSDTFHLDYADPHCDINPTDYLPVADWIGNNGSNTYTMFNAKDTVFPDTTTTGISYPPIPEVKLFPNPAYQCINIFLPSQLRANTQIEIYNLLGQTLYELSESNSAYIQINVSKWPSGNYYIRLLNNSYEQVSKFIIAR